MSPFRDHTYIYPSPYVSSHRNVLLLMSLYWRPCTDVSLYHCVYTYNYVIVQIKLQALVYDILPLTTALFSYAIRSRKLSANKQFFVGAQTVVSLLQTTQIKQGVSFIAANSLHQHKCNSDIMQSSSSVLLYIHRDCVDY